MVYARLFWSIWQDLLSAFTWAFTRPGHHRFVEWITALARCVEEHTRSERIYRGGLAMLFLSPDGPVRSATCVALRLSIHTSAVFSKYFLKSTSDRKIDP